MDFTLDLLIRASFGRGDAAVCRSELCRCVSGSYSNIQLSSPVIALSKMPGSSLTRCRRSSQAETHLCFWSSVKTFGMSLMQIFRIAKFSVKMLCTVILSRPIVSCAHVTDCLNSDASRTRCRKLLTLTAVQCGDRPPYYLGNL